ncbi:OB-fold nucleic acid binding domain-containing protein [Demequina sp. TTPB684]|uniref:OB-fold nucleic acid binding domain-containing protein n=1 Tax=unclassified Demequina TaxID=2620311 RepID=UPI001CF3E98F|nr:MULTISPECIES: OB-fold nucleic acid binding domain-containing protein [unclassified Demequina]MCB2413867.1 OB-fold nucleic acid binding domain-containing protein [Demequina sp. TTPB684]UPU89179.1 OB-fold nucleic acid binding domain-containing protein [Demequina sp. TMPB413]
MSVAGKVPVHSDWTPLGEVTARSLERTGGRISYVEVSPRDAPARLTVRLVDSTGALDLVFLGRRVVAGLEPGAIVSVEGRVAANEDVPRIFNPRYELCLT